MTNTTINQQQFIMTQEGLSWRETKMAELGKTKEHLKKQLVPTGERSLSADEQELLAALQIVQNSIAAVQTEIYNAVLVDNPQDSNLVGFNDRITICFDAGDTDEVTLVDTESDPLTGRISLSTPLGAAIYQMPIGEQIKYNIVGRKGTIEESATILAITKADGRVVDPHEPSIKPVTKAKEKK